MAVRRHDEPLAEAHRGAKCHGRKGVIVRDNLEERRNQVEKGNTNYLLKKLNILRSISLRVVHAGDEQLAEAHAFWLSLDKLTAIRTLLQLFGMATSGLGYGEIRASSGPSRVTGSGWRRFPWPKWG